MKEWIEYQIKKIRMPIKNILHIIIVSIYLQSCDSAGEIEYQTFKFGKQELTELCFFRKGSNIFVKGVNDCHYLFFNLDMKKDDYFYSNKLNVYESNKNTSSCDNYGGFVVYLEKVENDDFYVKHLACDSRFISFHELTNSNHFHNANIVKEWSYIVSTVNNKVTIELYSQNDEILYDSYFPYGWSDIACD